MHQGCYFVSTFHVAATAFILQRAMVPTFCSPGFLVSGSLGFWVSWFARFPAFLLSEFLVFVLNVTP